MGGIYTLGTQPGTVIRDNLLPRHRGAQLRRVGHLLRRGQHRHRRREQPRLPHHARRLPPALRQGQRRPQQRLRLRPRRPDPPLAGRAAPELHVRAQHRHLANRIAAHTATGTTTGYSLDHNLIWGNDDVRSANSHSPNGRRKAAIATRYSPIQCSSIRPRAIID